MIQNLKSYLSMNNELLLILMSCSSRALFLNRSYRALAMCQFK